MEEPTMIMDHTLQVYLQMWLLRKKYYIHYSLWILIVDIIMLWTALILLLLLINDN